MSRAIILNFPPKIPRETRNQLIESANIKVEGMKDDINSWNGFIDVVKTDQHQFSFIAKCDNEVVRSKMQELLDGL